jgi:hypothetical protein
LVAEKSTDRHGALIDQNRVRPLGSSLEDSRRRCEADGADRGAAFPLNAIQMQHGRGKALKNTDLDRTEKPIIGLVAAFRRATRRSALSEEKAGSTVYACSRMSQTAVL